MPLHLKYSLIEKQDNSINNQYKIIQAISGALKSQEKTKQIHHQIE